MSFRTFIMIKPDGVSRGLTGSIISRFEKRGFRLIKCQMLQPSKDLAEKHYEEHRGKDFFDRITDYISSGPVVAFVVESPCECINIVRKMIGKTDPVDAEPGTIRGDFAISKYQNVIHASDSTFSAEREIALWFS
jgi:nucleoside-diphosphate kinase